MRNTRRSNIAPIQTRPGPRFWSLWLLPSWAGRLPLAGCRLIMTL